MISFTWLRFRTQALIALGGLVIVAVALALTGFHMADVYNTSVVPCHRYNDCAAVLQAFPPSPDRAVLSQLGVLLTAVPGLIGIFWGAPLVEPLLGAPVARDRDLPRGCPPAVRALLPPDLPRPPGRG
jgi:hypothetical protein